MKVRIIASLLMFVSSSCPALAAEVFSSHEVKSLSLVGKLAAAWEERDSEKREYHELELKIDDQKIPIKAKIVGSRRAGYFTDSNGKEKLVCPYPNFKFKLLKPHSFFDTEKTYYFVSHCNDNELNPDHAEGFEGLIAGSNNVIREYMTYRFQSILTSMSVKVRLIKMFYHDTGKKKKEVIDRYGFIMEDFSDLAKRNAFTLTEDEEELDLTKIDRFQLMQQVIFEWFIGNEEYSYNGPIRHNILFFKTNKDFLIPMAFDFNETELVETDHNEYNRDPIIIKCESDNEAMFVKTMTGFIQKQAVLKNLISSSLTFLSQKDRIYLPKYVDSQIEMFKKILNEKAYAIKKSKGMCEIEQKIYPKYDQ